MIDAQTASELVAKFQEQRILIVGDLILDRYVSGAVNRISPEAPVPIVRVTGEYARPGGAANVASNVRSLGGRVVVAGIVGGDRQGEELTSALASRGICTDGVLVSKGMHTTVKTRIVAEHQQVVRVDREDSGEFSGDVLREFRDRVAGLMDGVTGVIIEDYGKGVVSQDVVDAVCAAAREADVPVGLDPKDGHDLDIRGVTLATPNYMEACDAVGRHPEGPRGEPDSGDVVVTVGQELLAKWQCKMLLLTLGPQGMCLICEGREPARILAVAREVYDVSGAGDTVIASAMLSLVAGAGRTAAATLANFAAGVVVGKLGTATCSAEELLAAVG